MRHERTSEPGLEQTFRLSVRAFRDLVLPMVLSEVRAGRLMPEDHARMVDRNALAEGQPQPFGTNRPCRDGRFDRSSIDTVDAVDQRRREIGMDILLRESLSLFDSLCVGLGGSLGPMRRPTFRGRWG